MNKQDTEKLYYLVYARVSSQRQVNEGDGLGSQEQRCLNWIKAKNGVIEKVFRDEGVSGGLFDRPAMTSLLKYLDDNAHKNYVVVFDDLTRLARDVNVHLRLKMELCKVRGAVLECPNFNFDNSPEGEFIETILAGKAELDRKQNRRQVIQKQKARLERGYWPFCTPLALHNIKDREHGKILVPKEPFASIFKEAIEAYEKDLLNSETEVKDFINLKFKEVGLKRTISNHGVQATLSKALYAGYIEYEPWEVERRDGKHKGFISKQTFENVQNKRLGKSKPRMAGTYSEDFPLRGFVSCEECGKKLRASWNTGNGGKYPNYWCQTKGCSLRYKVTKRKVIHGEFEVILSGSKLEKDKIELSKAIFMDTWDTLASENNQHSQHLQQELGSIDDKIDMLVERISSASNQTLISTYEEKVTKLSNKKTEISEVLKIPKYTEEQFGTALNKVYNALENPISLWNSDNLEDKRTVLYMFFENGLSYRYKEGFGTANFSDGINLLRDSADGKIPDVEMRGSDPLSASEG
jgi:site-specific DNA recombinase